MDILVALLGTILVIVGVVIGCFVLWVMHQTTSSKDAAGANAFILAFGVIAVALLALGLVLMSGNDTPEVRPSGVVYPSHGPR
jgi:uncharacterized Tic20 family protein